VRSASSNSQFEIQPGRNITPADDAEYYHIAGERERLLQDPGYRRLGRELEFRMARVYARVVNNCLHAGMTSTGGLDEDFEYSIEVQQETPATLRRLLDAL
jgi:hypothetical protein